MDGYESITASDFVHIQNFLSIRSIEYIVKDIKTALCTCEQLQKGLEIADFEVIYTSIKYYIVKHIVDKVSRADNRN